MLLFFKFCLLFVDYAEHGIVQRDLSDPPFIVNSVLSIRRSRNIFIPLLKDILLGTTECYSTIHCLLMNGFPFIAKHLVMLSLTD
jgi:hypothetical protein